MISTASNKDQLLKLAKEEIRLERKLKNHPSMQTLKEKEFLYQLAKDYYTNEGSIFDAGLYLGVSTLCFGRGLKRNEKINLEKVPAKPIQSFELGICTNGIAQKINKLYPDILAMKGGDSFLPLLRKNIEEIQSLTDLYEGDIIEWLPKLPERKYEIVFLDVLKLASINDVVISKVFPNMIPGKTVVIQQDFMTPSLPWIQISMGYLKDYFEYLFTCSASTVYLNTKQIPTELATKNFYDDFTLEESLDFMTKSFPSDLNETGYYKMELAKGLLVAYKAGLNQGIKYLEGCRSQYNRLSQDKPWILSVDAQIKYVTRLDARYKKQEA